LEGCKIINKIFVCVKKYRLSTAAKNVQWNRDFKYLLFIDGERKSGRKDPRRQEKMRLGSSQLLEVFQILQQKFMQFLAYFH